MTEGDCLDAFLSRDPQRIWQACGWVRTSWDRAALRRLAAEKARIEAATKGIDLGGMLRPNALLLTRALRRLDPATDDGHLACTCKACGTAYLVTEVMGYHYPWYRWDRA